MTCPGSFALCAAVEDTSTSIYAAAGSVAHALAEACLGDKDFILEDQVGCTVDHGGLAVEITAEMVATIQVYLNVIETIRRPGCVVRHEQRVSLDRWWHGRRDKPPTPMFGTADTWIFDPWTRRLTVVDFKYGSGVYVAVQDNPQLLYYAAGVAATIPYPVRDIQLVVVQPRARGQEPVRADVLDVLDLRLWIDRELIPAVARVTDPSAPLVLGTHCRFCAAKPSCPAQANRAADAARAEFPDLPELLGLSGLS